MDPILHEPNSTTKQFHNPNVRWEPVLIALAEREACYETRMVGGLRLKHWYEYRQSYNPSYWQYTCLICSANFHEAFAVIRFGDQSDSEMRAILIARSNVAVHAIEAHAAEHTDELEHWFGVDLLDAAETAIRMGMESRDAIRDVLKYVPPICNREEQLP